MLLYLYVTPLGCDFGHTSKNFTVYTFALMDECCGEYENPYLEIITIKLILGFCQCRIGVLENIMSLMFLCSKSHKIYDIIENLSK